MSGSCLRSYVTESPLSGASRESKLQSAGCFLGSVPPFAPFPQPCAALLGEQGPWQSGKEAECGLSVWSPHCPSVWEAIQPATLTPDAQQSLKHWLIQAGRGSKHFFRGPFSGSEQGSCMLDGLPWFLELGLQSISTLRSWLRGARNLSYF